MGSNPPAGFGKMRECQGEFIISAAKDKRVNRQCRAFIDDPPWSEEGSVQQDRGILMVLPVVRIQARHGWLNHQMGKTVGGCSKDVGDAGVHRFIITRVGRQLPGDEVRTNNME